MRTSTDHVDDQQTTEQAPLLHDVRLLVPAALSWLVVGVLLGLDPAVLLWVGAGFALIAAGLLVIARRRGVPAVVASALATACVSVAVLSLAGQASQRAAGGLPDLANSREPICVTAHVRTDPKKLAPKPGRPERFVITVHAEHATPCAARPDERTATGALTAFVEKPPAGLTVGHKVHFRGRLKANDRADPTAATISVTNLAIVEQPPVHLRAAETLREGLRNATSDLPPDPGGLLPGLVVGDTSRLPATLESDMRTAGLTHLTAVSGSNVAVIAAAAMLGVALVGGSMALRVWAALLAVVAFVFLVRAEPSVIRATVMGMVCLIGTLSSRRGRGISALSVAVWVIVVIDPWLSRSFGFALSTLATGAIVLLAPWLGRILSRWLPLKVADIVAIPLAAQAVCGPVTVLLSPTVSLLAVPSNILAAAAVAPATVCGVASAIVSPWWLWGGQALAWLGSWPAQWICWVAHTAAELPGASVPWLAGPWGVVALLIVTALAFWALSRLPGGGPTSKVVQTWSDNVPPRVKALCSVAALAVLVAMGVPWAVSRALQQTRNNQWVVASCDVGQGDTTLVRTGQASALMIDVGPPQGGAARCLQKLGITNVDVLVLTHNHLDHVGGLPDVMRAVSVTTVVTSPLPGPVEQQTLVDNELRTHSIQAQQATSGLGGHLGQIAWKVLWPTDPMPVADTDNASSTLNSSSVTLHLTLPGGVSFLLLGDLETQAQSQLANLLQKQGGQSCHLVKVAHHGSAKQHPALYEQCQPSVALLSCARRNDYGHPAPSTVTLLERIGAQITRTDQHGTALVGITATDQGPTLWVSHHT